MRYRNMLSLEQKEIIRNRIHYREHDYKGDRIEEYYSAGSWYMEAQSTTNLQRNFLNNDYYSSIDNTQSLVDEFMYGYSIRKLKELCRKYPDISERYAFFFGEDIYKNELLGENSGDVDL